MQDRYVADVGDFGKYGLLRCLTGITCVSEEGKLKLGVIWYLTPSCLGNVNDGRHLGYLDKKKKFKDCDESLFDALEKIRGEITTLDNGNRVRLPNLMRTEVNHCRVQKPALERVQDAGFLGTELFFDEPLCASIDRAKWWENTRESLKDKCDLVFMDPDNGLRVHYEDNNVRFIKEDPSPSPKHVYIEEIKGVITNKSTSLVFYHHLGRHGGKHDQQINKIANCLKAEFSDEVSIFCIRYRRGSGRAFFILAQGDYKDVLTQRITQFVDPDSNWVKRKHLELAYPKQ
jgi:hypothetical protein